MKTALRLSDYEAVRPPSLGRCYDDHLCDLRCYTTVCMLN